jgi:hypothetical protein
MLQDHIQLVGDIPRIPHLNNSVIETGVLGSGMLSLKCLPSSSGTVGIVSRVVL